MKLLRHRNILSSFLVVVAAVFGCDDGRPTRVPVSGQVLIDGKPLKHGSIRLIADNARPSTGRIGPDGRFQLTCFAGRDGSVLGTHKVTVSGVEPLGSTSQRWHAPKRYTNASTSGLTVTIDNSTDSLLIELTWNGKQPFVEKFIGGG